MPLSWNTPFERQRVLWFRGKTASRRGRGRTAVGVEFVVRYDEEMASLQHETKVADGRVDSQQLSIEG